jgi:hypothetical protein
MEFEWRVQIPFFERRIHSGNSINKCHPAKPGSPPISQSYAVPVSDPTPTSACKNDPLAQSVNLVVARTRSSPGPPQTRV